MWTFDSFMIGKWIYYQICIIDSCWQQKHVEHFNNMGCDDITILYFFVQNDQ